MPEPPLTALPITLMTLVSATAGAVSTVLLFFLLK